MREQSKKNFLISHVSEDIGIVDMLYSHSENKTKFAVYKDDRGVSYCEGLTILNESFVPLSIEDTRVLHGFIKFPEEAEAYESISDLYEEVKSFVSRYVFLSDDFTIISTLYIIMTWIYESFDVVPYLRVIGTFGTGKSRFLKVAGMLCYKATSFGGSASLSSIFRTIDEVKGTFLFDEADFRDSNSSSEIVRVLNAGHSKGAFVTRSEQQGKNGIFKPTCFYVFSPKVLASREKFEDEALESRCLTQYMIPQMSFSAPINLPKEFEQEATMIRNKLLMFRFRNLDKIKISDKTSEKINNPRVRQTISPILVVAQLVSNEVVDVVENFAKGIELDLINSQLVTTEADVLISIYRVLMLEKDKKKIHMKEIANLYNSNFGSYESDSSSIEINSPRLHISPRKVGYIIRQKLHLRATQDRNGYYIPIDIEKSRLESLKGRYGITDEIIGVMDDKESLNIEDCDDDDILTPDF